MDKGISCHPLTCVGAKTAAMLLCGLVLEGCVSVTAQPPTETFGVARTDIGNIANCSVRKLDERFAQNEGVWRVRITHRIDTVQIGKVLEVRPTQDVTLGIDVWVVRIALEANGQTKIDVFTGDRFDRTFVIEAARFCATQAADNRD